MISLLLHDITVAELWSRIKLAKEKDEEKYGDEIYKKDQPSFEQWMEDIDNLLYRKVGRRTEDLRKIDYEDFWQPGKTTAVQMVNILMQFYFPPEKED